MPTIKKIILWILVVSGVLMIYFSAYLPFTKASKYINAVVRGQRIRSVDEFKELFDSVFGFYSPVGGEEMVKFLSNDILSIISQEQASEEVSRLLVEYIESKFFDNNVRHMITGMRAYEILWRRYNKEEYFQKAESYFKKAYAIGPNLPPVLYPMLNLYYSHGDNEKAKGLAEEILRHWPQDERIKPFLKLPASTI